MDVYRKAEIFDALVYYLIEVDGFDETVWTLKTYGLSDEEIREILEHDFPEKFEKE